MKLFLTILSGTCLFILLSFQVENKAAKTDDSSTPLQFDDTLIVRDMIFANFFSPNGDGNNDTYQIINVENYPQNYLKVFNRWGETVYNSSPYHNEWDGTCNINGPLFGNQCSDGVYFFEFYDGLGTKATGKITLKR